MGCAVFTAPVIYSPANVNRTTLLSILQKLPFNDSYRDLVMNIVTLL